MLEYYARSSVTQATVKMLSLSFLVRIGVALIGEGLDQRMAFSVGVERLSLRVRRAHRDVVQLRRPYPMDPAV